MERSKIICVVGLAAEAGLLRRSAMKIEIGGGDAAGAAAAVARLPAKNIDGIISFGLAGGLNPDLRPGAVLVPRAVVDADSRFFCDEKMLEMLGGATCESILGSQQIAGSAAAKRDLFRQSGADAVDLESGAVARAAAARDIPFAVLRAVADPAARDLPPAALIALRGGKIKISSVLASLLKQPWQIPALLGIAQDAAKARAALIRQVRLLDL